MIAETISPPCKNLSIVYSIEVRTKFLEGRSLPRHRTLRIKLVFKICQWDKICGERPFLESVLLRELY